MLLHCYSSCHSTVSPAVAWIVHVHRLKRQNQSNSFHRWLSGACVFLPIAVLDIVENSQGGNLITLYSIIDSLYLSLWLNLTIPALLPMLHCHSSCHSTVAPSVAWIVHGRCLKRRNQGNGFHRWLLGACVLLPIAEFDIVENSQCGNLITLYYWIELS